MIAWTDDFEPVTVIIPSSGLARYAAFEMSVEGLQVPSGSAMFRAISANLAGSVNEAIRRSPTPWYWFIDDDHQFDPWILLRLLAHKVPVVVPLTNQSKPPFHPVLFRDQRVAARVATPAERAEAAASAEALAAETMRTLSGAGLLLEGAPDRTADLATRLQWCLLERLTTRAFLTYSWAQLDRLTGLVPVFACGRSGLLVRRDVLDAIGDPYFTLGQQNPEEPGDDTTFCRRVRESEFAIVGEDGQRYAAYVDLELVNGHTAPVTAIPHRGEDGRWTTRLLWDNGESILIHRPDLKAPIG